MIAHASSRAAGIRSLNTKRWNEIVIFREETAGGYIVRSEGHSTMPGERTFSKETAVTSGADALAALRGAGGATSLTRVAREAIVQAADRDPTFARGIESEVYEDFDALAGDGEIFTLRRAAGERPLRVRGVHLASTTSRVDEDDKSWTEFDLYRGGGGRQIVAIKRHVFRGGYVDRAVTQAAGTAADIALGFTRPGSGWVEGALIEALAIATRVDAAIAAEIPADVAGWGRKLVGSTGLVLGDARFRALEALLTGFVLRTTDSAEGPSIVAWAPREGAAMGHLPAMTLQLFLALSKRRLIQHVGVDRAGVYTWTVSPKGEAALAAARAGGTGGRSRAR